MLRTPVCAPRPRPGVRVCDVHPLPRESAPGRRTAQFLSSSDVLLSGDSPAPVRGRQAWSRPVHCLSWEGPYTDPAAFSLRAEGPPASLRTQIPALDLRAALGTITGVHGTHSPRPSPASRTVLSP